jgi:two-component system, LuxR family, sensor kinase FixL
MSGIETRSRPRSHLIVFQPMFAFPRAAIGVAYLACYILLDRVSFVHPYTAFGITPWNPGTGLSLSIVLLFGRSMIPFLFPAQLLADLVNRGLLMPWGVELLSSAIIGAGYAAAAIFLLVPQLRFNPTLSSMHDLKLLIAVAVVSSAIVATTYVGVMIAARLLPSQDFAEAALRYWVGDAIGIVVTAPFALMVLTRRHVFRATVETALQIGASIAALAVVFGFAREKGLQLFYVLLLPIVWMAVQGGLEGAVAGIVITQVGLIVGLELFSHEVLNPMALQIFMLVLAVTGLVAGELVNERRRAESQLRLHRELLAKKARLGSLGELAAAVAHEINQPLAAAGTYTRLVRDAAQEGGADPAMVAETAKKAAAQVERAAEVVRRLRSLVRLDRSCRAPCGVELIVRQTIAMCQPLLDRINIAVDWNRAANVPPVMVDMLQVEQTLMNLIRNSIEAIGESKQSNGAIRIDVVSKDSNWVEISVADNGPGFPTEFVELFPLLSSHKPEGIGIGLSLCRSIIEAHGGRLWLNRSARGAEVRFTLPIATEVQHG